MAILRVPNVVISIRATNNCASDNIKPRWYADMFRAVWGRKLHEENGLVITELPDNVPEAQRYSTYENGVASAEEATVRFFCGLGDDPKRDALITSTFKELFPNGLGKIIDTLILEDLERVEARRARLKASPVPHKSFLDLELTADEALAMQQAGWANVAECSSGVALDFVKAGLPAEKAALLAEMSAKRAG